MCAEAHGEHGFGEADARDMEDMEKKGRTMQISIPLMYSRRKQYAQQIHSRQRKQAHTMQSLQATGNLI